MAEYNYLKNTIRLQTASEAATSGLIYFSECQVMVDGKLLLPFEFTDNRFHLVEDFT